MPPKITKGQGTTNKNSPAGSKSTTTTKKTQDKTKPTKGVKNQNKGKKENKQQKSTPDKKSPRKPKKQTEQSEEITDEQRALGKTDFEDIANEHLQTLETKNVLDFEIKAINGEFAGKQNLKYLRLSDFLAKFTKIDFDVDPAQVNIHDLICLIYARIIFNQLSDTDQQKLKEIEQKMRSIRWVPETLLSSKKSIEEIYFYIYLSKIENIDNSLINQLLTAFENNAFSKKQCETYLNIIISEYVPTDPIDPINEKIVAHCLDFLS